MQDSRGVASEAKQHALYPNSGSVTVPASTTVSAAAISTSATTAGTLFARPSDVNVHGSPAQFCSVQGVNGFLRLFG